MAVTIVASLGRGDGAGGVIDAEDAATLRECGLAHAVAQEAVVADAVEAVRQDVQELCGGANYVARRPRMATLSQR